MADNTPRSIFSERSSLFAGGLGEIGGGAAGRRPSLASLIGEDAAQLQRTGESIDRLAAMSAALGAKDTTGMGPKQFLTGALDYYTRGQSGLLGFFTGLTGGQQPGEAQGALQRAAAGFSGKERFTGGDIIGKAGPNASILERTARGLTGFGIDVATDPLNLLTLGRGGYLKGIASGAAAEAQVLRSARNVLKPAPTPEIPIVKPVTAASASGQASERAITRADNIRTATEPVVSLGSFPTTATRAPSIPEALPGPTFRERQAAGNRISSVEPIATPAIETNDEFVTRLAQAAGSGQSLGGGRGTRDAMIKVARERYTGANEAEAVVDSILKGTTGELRGGIGLRIPFIGRDLEGRITTAGQAATRRVADLTPGSGKLVDEIGLRSLAEDARSVYNDYRSSGFFRGYSKIFNGKFGAQYADFIRTAHKGEGTMDYARFSKEYAADNARTAAAALRDQTYAAIVQTADKMVRESTDPKKVSAAKDKYFQMADNMVLDAGADEADQLGFEIASTLRQATQNVRTEITDAAARAGVDDIGMIAKNFIARPLSLKERLLRATQGKKTGVYSADKSRRIGYDTDELGRLDSRSNVELNEDFRNQLGPDGKPLRPAGHDVFETDALKIVTQQLASYSKILTEINLIGDLKAIYPLTELAPSAVRLVNLPKLVKRGEKFQSALTNVGERLAVAMNTAIANNDMQQLDRISTAITKIAADKVTINSLLANIKDTNPESLRVIGNLTKILKTALATGEGAGVALTKAEKARLFSANGLVVTRGTSENINELLAAGLKPIGKAENIRIPRGLDNMYADETVKDAIERYFKIETGGFQDSKFFNEVYQPYYTLLKTWITVGRPGGYHLRNLQGAWWNNYLGDVSGADHSLSASVLNETRKSNTAAANAIANIRAGKASGLTGDEDKIAQDIVALGRARGSNVVEYEQAQLGNYILAKRLEKIKVGDTTMADVLSAAKEQGILRGNRQLEYLRDAARADEGDLADAIANPNYRNLFKGSTKDELNAYQRTLNKTVNWPYISISSDLAELSENYVRLAAFISGARRYGVADNGTAAGYLTKALQFDYADLSEAERKYIKNIIPFYTWTRRNVPLQFSALLNNPGKFNKLDFAKEELQNQFGAEGDQEAMQEIIPEWVREKMGFVTKFTGGGGPISFGIESPAMDLNRYLAFGNPLSSSTIGRVKNEVISASNPLFKAVVENMTGTDLFTGGKFPENGVASPFGPNKVVPGITFTGPDGDQRVDAQGYGAIKDLIPPLGLMARLLSSGEADRRLTNWLSTLGGLPVSTLTPGQLTSELKSREDRLYKQYNRLSYTLGVDQDWLRNMVDSGATSDEIRSYIASGAGKVTRPEM